MSICPYYTVVLEIQVVQSSVVPTGPQREATVESRILRANGFSVDSVVCKNRSLPKEKLGLADEGKVTPGDFEIMCDPIGQARALAPLRSSATNAYGRSEALDAGPDSRRPPARQGSCHG